MLLRNRKPSSVGCICALLLSASGCGDGVSPPPTAPPVDIGQPPPAPENASLPDGPGATFAIAQLRLGRNDPDGMLNKDLWKSFGYNLDHTLTIRSSAGVFLGGDVCARVEGANEDMVLDGIDGRDNAFGSHVLPIITAVNADAEKSTNNLVGLGRHTLLIDVRGIGSAATYQLIKTNLYEGRAFVDAQGMAASPQFDGTDIWPIAFESVVNGNPQAPLATSTTGYIVNEGPGGTFVGHFDGNIVLHIDVFTMANDDGVLRLRIHEPLITMRLSADRTHTESGVLAGFIDTNEIVAEEVRLLGVADKSLCTSQTPDSLALQLRQSSDILRHGQKEAAKPCDSISIGIEFDAVRAQIGMVAPPAVPPQDPCTPPSP